MRDAIELVCPFCGEDVQVWSGTIVECPSCNSMYDAEVLIEELFEPLEEEDTWR